MTHDLPTSGVASAAVTCPQGHRNRPDARFCTTCGGPLPNESPSAPRLRPRGNAGSTPGSDAVHRRPPADKVSPEPSPLARHGPAIAAGTALAIALATGAGLGLYFGAHRGTAPSVTAGAAASPGTSIGADAPPTSAAAAPASAGAAPPSGAPTSTVPPTTAPVAPSSPLAPIDAGAVAGNTLVSAVTATLETYFGGIDNHDPAAAYVALTPSYQSTVDYNTFASGVATTTDSNVTISLLVPQTDNSVVTNVFFTSHQAASDGPSRGETCTNWYLAYDLKPAPTGDTYLIDSVTPVGAGHLAC
jgi:hypothetical protein